MWRDLESFHALGILVRDVRIRNYMGGKLIDLSRALTMPHPSLMHISAGDLDEERRMDAHSLRMAILDHGDDEGWLWSEVRIPDDLVKCAIGDGPGEYGIDLREYNWKKWEKRPAVAEALWPTRFWRRNEGLGRRHATSEKDLVGGGCPRFT